MDRFALAMLGLIALVVLTLLGLPLAGAVVIAGAAVLVFSARARYRITSAGSHDAPPRPYKERVGANVASLMYASYPFARLTATPDTIRVSFLIARTVIHRDQVQLIYERRWLGRTAIEFRTHDQSADGWRVYPLSRRVTLARLAALGWPVGEQAGVAST